MLIKFRYQLLQLTSIQLTILTLWALIMVSLSIADWSPGGNTLISAITVGVIITAGIVIAFLWEVWGSAAAFRVAGLILIFSWGAELIGSRTAIPFGAYDYTQILQPQILNIPVQIPLGWLMMLPPSWAVAQALTERIRPRCKLPAFIGLSALAMTAWDLMLDPIMVSWEVWAWDHPVGYFGIPWTNFLGWLLVSALITILIRPGKLPVAPLLLIYTSIWLLKSVGSGVFWGIPGAAVFGWMIMGIITILAWRAVTRREEPSLLNSRRVRQIRKN